MNMIQLTQQDRDGFSATCLINVSAVTTAIYVHDQRLTALNITGQPTVWVAETPEEIYHILTEETD